MDRWMDGLFVLILYVPDIVGTFPGLNQYKQRIKCCAQKQNTVHPVRLD